MQIAEEKKKVAEKIKTSKKAKKGNAGLKEMSVKEMLAQIKENEQ
ncbi:MAG: hypothetical protein KatS3mg101_0473 [Patescibacteria group bacterium]|nr:MAG: hypothetical protein KatS3mg101_0473 [Patescibacteria group bacterium]